MILQKLDQLCIIQQHGLGNWAVRFLLFWSKFWTLSFGPFWNFRMYELLLKEFVDCLLWSPSRSLRIACIKQTLLVFIIKYNFPEFWCHCVCRVHVCTENRTRFRHCPAGSHSQVGTLSQNNTFLLHWDTFLLLFNTCWIIPILRSRAKYFDNVGEPVWDLSLHLYFVQPWLYNVNGTIISLFHPSLGIVRCIIDMWTIKIC